MGMETLNTLMKLTLSVALFTLISLSPFSNHAKAAESASLLARKGNTALKRRENEKAIQYFSEALFAGALEIYTKASILNDRGLAYSRLKKFHLALKDFNRAIEAFPEYAKAYNNRGLLLHRLGHNEEAIKDFNRAIALHPSMGVSYHNRANAFLKAGAEKPAFSDFGKAATLLADKSPAHLARGQIHWKHLRHYAALRELNLSLEKNKNQALAYFNRGQVYHSLGNRVRAIQDIAKASSLDPKDLTFKKHLAIIYLENRQLPNASKLFSQILNEQPLNLEIMILRGRINGDLGRYQKALEDLDQAVSLSASASAFAERALVQAKNRQPDFAIADISESIQKAPKTGRSWAVLGDAARLSDKLIDAERYYLEALKRDKMQPKALTGLKQLGFGLDEEEIETVASIGTEVNGWSIQEPEKGKYVAINPLYKKYKIKLDLYGPKKPKILEWTVLKGNYKGYGLLRYDAGSKNQKSPIEHVAILNLRKQRVETIEPYRWGTKIAKWTWNQNDVVIKDPDGIQNKVTLRVPVRRKPPRVASQGEDTWHSGFWNSGPKKRVSKKKRRRKVRRKKKKSLFGGIFGF
ncbi:hypothetical protein NBRC116602_19830 [Hyphomicrobiales bacterium 4NK60-0047b]